MYHEHSGGRPQGGIGAAAHFESSEARLMWIDCSWWSVSRFYLLITGSWTDWTDRIPAKHNFLTPFLATSGRKSNDVPCMARPSAIIVFYVFILHKYFAHACAMGVSDPLHHKVLEAHCATVKTLCWTRIATGNRCHVTGGCRKSIKITMWLEPWSTNIHQFMRINHGSAKLDRQWL